jgi:hypothetical protein
MRNPYFDQPMSRLAAWSGRLGIFALAVAVLSIVIVRSDLLETTPALATFGAALVFAALAILFAFAAFVVIWREGLTGLGRALLGLFLGVALLAYPAFLGYRATQLPALNDITTDPAHPPSFDALARLRPSDRNDYPGAQAAARQAAAYPDVEPLEEDASAVAAYRAALAVVTKRRWQLVATRPPASRNRAGVIEAVARTPIMGFQDDVVIRVSSMGTGSRIDIRSASRVGTHDFGTNAARVLALLEDIDTAISALPPEPHPEPEKRPSPRRVPEKKTAPRR